MKPFGEITFALYRKLRLPLGLSCLAAALLARPMLEKAMLTHMLVQLPLLFASGWLLRGAWQARQAKVSGTSRARYDQHGLTGLLIVMLVSAYWMVPRGLELALNMPLQEVAKIAAFFLAGWILPGSWSRTNVIVQIFFIGNYCWMTAIAGMLYQDSPQRLCNAYLLDDQIDTGMGLVALSILIGAGWATRLIWKQQALAAPAAQSVPITTKQPAP